MGEAAVIGEMEVMKVKLEDAKGTESDLRDQISGLKDNVEQLKSQLRDKDEIINLLKNK